MSVALSSCLLLEGWIVIDSFHHRYPRIYGFVLPVWRYPIFDRVFALMVLVLILKRALPRFLFIVNSRSLCVS